ncbi:MAG TPA: hypothetical protein VHA13_02395, partial [Gammaproteobacteria bacterium]|nr:hypothetical protein [Gammaproteobacteria bacterium]
MSNTRNVSSTNTSAESKQKTNPLLEVERLLFKTKELPSKLKTKIQPLVLQHFNQEKEDKENSFADGEIRIYADRRTQQYLLVGICSRIFDTLDEILALHNKSVPLNISVRANKDKINAEKVQTALLNFKQHYGKDYQRILNLNREISNKLINFEKNENTFMPAEAIYLWQALNHGEEHLNEYKPLIAEILAPLKSSNKTVTQKYTASIIDHFQKLYDFKKELRQLDLINLYVHRLRQHIDEKSHRQLNFNHCWLNNDIFEPLGVTGFAEACKDYRNQFARVTLLQTLKKSTAFDTYQNLTKLLSLEEAPKLNSIINEASPEITNLILSWANEAIHNMTHKIIIWNEVYAPNGQRYLLATNKNP